MTNYKFKGYCPNNPACREIIVKAETEVNAWIIAMTEYGMLSIYETTVLEDNEQ